MIEKEKHPLKTIEPLNDQEAIYFVLRALTRSYIGDVPEPEEQREKNPDVKPESHLVELGPDEYFSPVFGPKKKGAV
jgi:hypothetical protein